MELVQIKCSKCGWTGKVEKTAAQDYYHQGCPICKEKNCVTLTDAAQDTQTRKDMLLLINAAIEKRGIEKTMEDISNLQSIHAKSLYITAWNNKYRDKNRFLLIGYL